MRITGGRVCSLLLCFSFCMLLACGADREQTLRLGLNTWPGYETLVLARELGYFDAADIHLVEMPSATEVMHAMRTGALEVAALTLDETLMLLQSGLNLKVLLVMDISDGGDVLLARPELSSIKALKGKRIGVENTALGAMMLDSALSMGQLAVDDIRIVSMTVDRHFQAFQQGQVDALVTFEPVTSRLQAKGAITLFDSSQIPGRILDVLVVRSDVLKAQTDNLVNLLRGHFRALNYLHEHPAEAHRLMAPRLGISPAELATAYKGLKQPNRQENLELFTGHPSALQQRALHLIDLMKSKNLLILKPDVGSLVAIEPLEAATW